MNGMVQGFMQMLINKNPQIANNPNAVEMLNVIKNNDSKRGMEIAENLCKEHNVSKNEALNMARNCFRI